MPIYEYQCTQCDHSLEALQKISYEPLTICPNCDNPTLNKLVSAASFRLKGGGWYETDFKTGDKKQLAESDSSSKSTNGTSGSKKESSTKKEAAAPKSDSKNSTSKSSTK